jgi:IS30 family transposase
LNGEPSPSNKYGSSAHGHFISDFIEFQVKPWFRNADFLRQKYVEEGLSTQQIADLVGSARCTVSRHLKAFKIRLRTDDEARRLRKAHAAYGERLQDGKPVSCKREQEVIAMIKNLRDKEMGLQAIADFLNASGIKTKTRKAKWQTATVWYILDKQRNASS